MTGSRRAQLPLNKPFDGLPWCGEQVNPATDSTTWKWDDGQKRIVVMVQTDGFISIQRMPDDPVSQDPPDGQVQRRRAGARDL
jgi:hypothetical protein